MQDFATSASDAIPVIFSYMPEWEHQGYAVLVAPVWILVCWFCLFRWLPYRLARRSNLYSSAQPSSVGLREPSRNLLPILRDLPALLGDISTFMLWVRQAKRVVFIFKRRADPATPVARFVLSDMTLMSHIDVLAREEAFRRKALLPANISLFVSLSVAIATVPFLRWPDHGLVAIVAMTLASAVAFSMVSRLASIFLPVMVVVYMVNALTSLHSASDIMLASTFVETIMPGYAAYCPPPSLEGVEDPSLLTGLTSCMLIKEVISIAFLTMPDFGPTILIFGWSIVRGRLFER